MKYKSTRGGSTGLSFEDALFTGYATDGGILVPDTIPSISKEQLKTWSRLGFVDLAKEITSLFVPDTEIPKQELNGSIYMYLLLAVCLSVCLSLCMYVHVIGYIINKFEPWHVISNNVTFDKCRLRRDCAASFYA